jgi:hypothetical protein
VPPSDFSLEGVKAIIAGPLFIYALTMLRMDSGPAKKRRHRADSALIPPPVPI